MKYIIVFFLLLTSTFATDEKNKPSIEITSTSKVEMYTAFF